MDKFEWIKKHIKSVDKENNFSAKYLSPDIFDSYFILVSSIGIIDDFPFYDYPETIDSIDSINRSIKINRDFGLFLNSDTENLFRITNLKEIASRFNIKYDYKVLNNIRNTRD